ncbi:HemK2/MTQ2 family protein methyltransferase [Natronobiforma cellulositropha]|uniref:HemK2/MTQ2 family protein methyltransferase n=1 Tax=Natronobiforma cellulositropha TaxID=1679076 RepID=UPI0021D5DC51|nr:HemK2/MTQ2 family protein methyltransferase [Natronobiforma cellulositropha]
MDLAERRGLETEVYQPAEDSHVLASVCGERLEDGMVVLEVGTGSGYVAERIETETGATVVGADLNPHACEQARERGVEVIRGDLHEPFGDGVFDAVVFNPPYLPVDPEATRDDWMEVALSGGDTGREVIEAFLTGVGRVLAPDGVVLLLVSSLTGVEEVVEFAGEYGFSAAARADESFPFETLTVLELWQ